MEIPLTILLMAGLAAATPAPPQFPDAYTAVGKLIIPSAEIVEPVTSYVSFPQRSSRIDYYDSTIRTYQLLNASTMYFITPVTTAQVRNQMTCFKFPGGVGHGMHVQPAVPDMSGFMYDGNTTCATHPNTKCESWVKNVSMNHGRKVGHYKMLVWRADDGTARPDTYFIYGYAFMFASYIDHYIISYEQFIVGEPSADKFKVPEHFTCRYPFGDKEEATNAGRMIHFNPLQQYIEPHTAHDTFAQFKNEHGRTYKTDETQRERNFHRNYHYIHSMNRKGLSYTLAVNHLADMTREERSAMNGARLAPTNDGLSFNASAYSAPAPPQLDWRLYGAVTPVKDQTVCGSCWSFAAIGATEGALFLKTGVLRTLSEQNLVDCSWGPGNNGCFGGDAKNAYSWMLKHKGIMTDFAYGHYKGQNGYCHYRPADSVLTLKSFVNVPPEHLELAVANHGPIAVNIDALHPSFEFYANGVYSEPACKNGPNDLHHAVLVVGYGTLNGERYWILKNSYSPHWGMDGYMLMAQKDNMCGVSTAATYVNIDTFNAEKL